jgi:hypothetical protein
VKSWRWWAGPGPIPVWLTLLLLAWSAWNGSANRELKAELDRVRAAGLPLRGIEGAPPAVPDDENAALIYGRLLPITLSPPGDFNVQDYAFHWREPVKPDAAPQLRAWAEAQAWPAELLRRAALRPRCRWPLDYSRGWAMDMPSLLGVNNANLLLGCRARHAFERGDRASAEADVLASLRLSASFADEPVILLLMMGVSASTNSLQLLASYLSAGGEVTPALRDAVARLPVGHWQAAAARAIANDRATLLELLVESYIESVAAEGAPAATVSVPIGPYIKKDLAHLSRIFQDWYAIASGPPVVSAWRTQEIQQRVDNGGLVTRIVMPDHSRMIISCIQADTVFELCRIAVEGMALARERDSWPESWPALQSTVDRVAGAPLKVRREGDGVVIWSLGRNVKDDGAHRNDDLVLRLYLKR